MYVGYLDRQGNFYDLSYLKDNTPFVHLYYCDRLGVDEEELMDMGWCKLTAVFPNTAIFNAFRYATIEQQKWLEEHGCKLEEEI